MLHAMSTVIAACTMEVEDTKFVQQPQQKFIRPVHGYMDFLDVQEELPHGGDVLYLERFRVSKDAVALILQLSKPHLPATFDTRLVLLVTIQWLASSVSVRSQEQMLFQDHNHVTLAYYRQLGVRAITKGLVDGGFYGSGPHEPTATACAPAVKHFVKSIQPSTSVLVLWMVPTSPSRCLRSQTEFEGSVPSGYLLYLGDAGDRLSKVLLTPYRNTTLSSREWAANTDGRPKTAKECFNYRHSKARIVVERVFGMLKIKWKYSQAT
ncbi:hypothetical protein B5M09_013812 [Aphanomyces astaci]|uniref:DDE Tnp4 domain-containing protein n=1 Tax=Aphanomyces astaci TaxID=112090 RepID=A0A3R7WLM0_APHAT|nr:hypothetical protein B5M09_013812 [Aphanomyces astaci]